MHISTISLGILPVLRKPLQAVLVKAGKTSGFSPSCSRLSYGKLAGPMSAYEPSVDAEVDLAKFLHLWPRSVELDDTQIHEKRWWLLFSNCEPHHGLSYSTVVAVTDFTVIDWSKMGASSKFLSLRSSDLGQGLTETCSNWAAISRAILWVSFIVRTVQKERLASKVGEKEILLPTSLTHFHFIIPTFWVWEISPHNSHICIINSHPF